MPSSAASMRRLVNVRRGGPPYLPGEPLRAPISHASIRTLNGPLPLGPVHCGILIMGTLGRSFNVAGKQPDPATDRSLPDGTFIQAWLMFWLMS